MCEKCGCTNPEKLKGDPEDCTPEQIEECHGDSEEHPCAEDKEEDWNSVYPAKAICFRG